jgi:dipeptidyl aminopeptidase/acylaminoacyl peptidase
VVRHCLEKKPEERFQSARDLIFDLGGSTGSSVTAGRPARVVPAWRPWLARGVIGLLALAAVAGGFLAGRRSATVHIPTFRQITFRRGIASSGRFTPDGKTVVYSARWDGGSCEIYSVRTDAPESRSLGLPPGQVVGVSSKGELAMLLTESFLYPQAAATLARVALSGGTPRPVAEGVVCADWAPDGERFAALRGSTTKGDRRIEFPLGTVLARQAAADRPLTCPRFSPHGDRLGFGTSDGYQVFETMGGRSFSIGGIPEWGHGTWWSWSPDGAEIWFTASDSAEERPLEAVSLSGRRRLLSRVPGAVTLYDVSREGLVLLEHAFTRERVFARAPGEVEERELSIFDRTSIQDMSTDGKFVLLAEVGAATHDTILSYLGRTDGSPPMRLAAFGEPTALSPDGRWVLVIPGRGTFGIPKWSGLRVIPVGAGDARDIATAGLLVDRADWVPDGKRILVSGRETDRGTRIFLFDPEAGGRRAITPEGVGTAHIPSDGRRVAVVGPTNRVTLYPLEGGEAREVPGLEPGTVPLRFSEDGASLLVSGPNPTRSAPIRIYRVVLASGARTLLHEIRPADMAGVWGLTFNFSPVVTPDGRGYAYNYYQFLHSLFLAEGLK